MINPTFSSIEKIDEKVGLDQKSNDKFNIIVQLV